MMGLDLFEARYGSGRQGSQVRDVYLPSGTPADVGAFLRRGRTSTFDRGFLSTREDPRDQVFYWFSDEE
ncbi:hypothetical protein DM785_17160 (plasmid) [Deinococcus actinosclerus]|nr:hypothetical protein DM785_17160 [Deinococcus actinosclerus]